MRNFKSIFLVLVLFICMLFGGCSKQQVDTTNYLTNDEYVEELKSITKSIFEEDVYTNKNEVLAFSKDMKSKFDNDEQSNLWYYNDQIYLLKIKSMYQDLYDKINNLNCSDESIYNIHKTLVSQIKDITQVSSTLLKNYSENDNIESLNSSIPEIKLIFTENPNEYKVTEIVKNELEGRIRRINGFIEGIIGVDVKEISDDILISSTSDENKENTSQNNTSSDSNNIQSNINKAIDLIYKATGEDRSYIMVEHISNPGTYVDSSKYYVFSLSARDGSFESDINYIVDKNTFKVYTCDPYGNINPVKCESVSNEQQSDSKQNKSNYKCLQYSDCTLDYIHGHYTGPDGEEMIGPEDVEGNRAYGVCGDCGMGVIAGEEHICNVN